MMGNSCITYPAQRGFHDKGEIKKKYQQPIGYEWTQNASLASVFQIKTRGRTPPPPPPRAPFEREKILPHRVYRRSEL